MTRVLSLSDRQLELLRLYANGRTYDQAATQMMGLSKDTVRTYAETLYANIGVRGQAHAVAVAFSLGALVPGDVREEAR